MKKAIFTVSIGNFKLNHAYSYALQAMINYARRTDADFFCKTTATFSKSKTNPPHIEKLYLKELLKIYDVVLYLDNDILITPEATNIFDHYPSTDAIYLLEEGWANRNSLVHQILHHYNDNTSWSVQEHGYYQYFNTGCMLCYKTQKKLFEAFDVDNCYFDMCYEQTYLNYLIQKISVNIQPLSKQFNYMNLFDFNQRHQASFIHYAGFYQNKSIAENLLISDYQNLYG